MLYKPSAGIFVGGLAASFGGIVLIMLSMQGFNDGGAMTGIVGVIVSISGIVMLCMGAARALAVIDALPAAFRNLDKVQAQARQQQAPSPTQPGQESHQPHLQNQGYNQPPAQ